MTNKPIAVFGATGAQGSPVVEALLKKGQSVRAIAHTQSKLKPLADRGIETVALELTDADALKHALSDVAGAFVHLPFIPVTELLKAQAEAVVAALNATNVPMTVFTLSGPPSTQPIGVVSFDSKAVIKHTMLRVQVPLIIFEPMGYLANLSAPFTAPGVVHDDELRYPLPAEHRQAWVSVEDQADLVLAAMERPDLAGRAFRIGTKYTGPELAAGISEGLSREIRYVPISAEVFGREIIAPMLGAQAGEALVHDYNAVAQHPPELDLDADTDLILQLLNTSLTPLSTWAANQNWELMAAIGSPQA